MRFLPKCRTFFTCIEYFSASMFDIIADLCTFVAEKIPLFYEQFHLRI